jgi:uncharacterized protein YbaR (Trm112 family)
MSLSPDLLAILACPEDNPRLMRAYAVRDGIPVMLIDEATTVDSDENDRLMALVAAGSIAPTFEPS